MKYLIAITFILTLQTTNAQIRPDEFPVETELHDSIAFYTQEDGMPRKIYLKDLKDQYIYKNIGQKAFSLIILYTLFLSIVGLVVLMIRNNLKK